jgi:curved DNA-binding protein CbpA
VAVAERDYYVILGIEPNARPDEVRSAYRRAARAHHPDLNPGDVAAADRFKRVQEAYEVLSDPARRAAYRRPRPSPPAPPPTWTGGSYVTAWRVGGQPAARARRPLNDDPDLSAELAEALVALRILARRAQIERRFRLLLRYLEGL